MYFLLNTLLSLSLLIAPITPLFQAPLETLRDAFLDCPINPYTIDHITMSPVQFATGGAIAVGDSVSLDIEIVLATPIVNIVERMADGKFDMPQDTRLIAVGDIVSGHSIYPIFSWELDSPELWGSFGMIASSDGRYWIMLFADNVSLNHDLQACGMYELRLQQRVGADA